MPVLGGKTPNEMRCAIADKVMRDHLGSDCFKSEHDVPKWFVLNNMELLSSLADLQEKLVELREWVEAQDALTDAQTRGNLANLDGLRQAASELHDFHIIEIDEWKKFNEEITNLKIQVREKSEH